MRGFGGASAFALAASLMMPTMAMAQQQAAAPVARMIAPTPLAPAAASAVVKPAGSGHFKGDPLEKLNRKLFSVHQFFDHLLFRPLAMAYKTIIPKIMRSGIRHVFSNIGEPVVFVNDVLQLKPKRAVRTLGRFAINSTIGVGGLVDVAKTKGFDLPHHSNGFGNTLGRYGVGPGPYLFLPFIGPSDFRDIGSAPVDGAVLPLAIGFPFDRAEYQIPAGVVVGLDMRAEADGDLKALLGGAVDPYATLRSAFLQTRAAEVYAIRHGDGAGATPLEDPLADPAGAAAQPSAAMSDPLTDPAAPAPVGETQSSTASQLSDPLADPAAAPAPTTNPEPKAAPATALDDPLTDPAAASAKP
ncbi:VacJ family lipoprotein [Sphingomonas sp. BAUL-RG-20F-R05-02]|uniref:MlaA family lipoprotein n=1 Tax=Sphingomonas sp. BAUL-RG-20F-R05-02 TaxID=2914830 RepID=UPI001F5A6E64|nr:VacJ family lipoprotein [Sphingomonas sp. BAUL-RG-20F-R05-02]